MDSEERSRYKIPAMRAFSEIATSLSSDADLEHLLDRFLQTMIRLAGAGGGAVRVLTAEDAARTTAALDMLAAVLAGGNDIDAGFADLVGREPTLPAHLRGESE